MDMRRDLDRHLHRPQPGRTTTHWSADPDDHTPHPGDVAECGICHPKETADE